MDVTGSSPPYTLTKTHDFYDGGKSRSGSNDFKKRTEVEAPPYLRHDRLTIECVITIVEDPKPFVEVPPSDITEYLGKLLQGKEGADVIFMVQGEDFPAHKVVLAMRPPVFKAELYGAMREQGDNMGRISISDMQPAFFDTLLHFVYTDSLPTMVDRSDSSERSSQNYFHNLPGPSVKRGLPEKRHLASCSQEVLSAREARRAHCVPDLLQRTRIVLPLLSETVTLATWDPPGHIREIWEETCSLHTLSADR